MIQVGVERNISNAIVHKKEKISKGKKTVELLAHFNCGVCKKWWAIGDAPPKKKKWFCPWCGTKQNYE